MCGSEGFSSGSVQGRKITMGRTVRVNVPWHAMPFAKAARGTLLAHVARDLLLSWPHTPEITD